MTAVLATDKALTRRERRIERMRTQVQPSAGRSIYRVSGTPWMARQQEFRHVVAEKGTAA